MPYGTINDCIITKRNSLILLPYIVSIDSKEYKLNQYELHDGVDIQCNDVYTPCNCVILQVINVDDYIGVLLQYSVDICLRFTHLKSVDVTPGQLVYSDTKIGEAYQFVHFEYLNIVKPDQETNWLVRFGPIQLYKCDPMLILDKSIVFNNTIMMEQDWGDLGDVQSSPRDSFTG